MLMLHIHYPDNHETKDMYCAEDESGVERNNLRQGRYEEHYQSTVGYSEEQRTQIFYVALNK